MQGSNSWVLEYLNYDGNAPYKVRLVVVDGRTLRSLAEAVASALHGTALADPRLPLAVPHPLYPEGRRRAPELDLGDIQSPDGTVTLDIDVSPQWPWVGGKLHGN